MALPFRRLPVDAAGRPLYLVRPASLAGVSVYAALEQIAEDRPDLPSPFSQLRSRASVAHPLALVGAEFFGGSGFQWSAAWTSTERVFGPLITASDPTEVEDDRFILEPLAGMAINRLLRWLGVVVEGAVDEFDTAGLGRSRSPTDDPRIG